MRKFLFEKLRFRLVLCSLNSDDKVIRVSDDEEGRLSGERTFFFLVAM
ncbi:hypothetical protein J2R76_003897 [Bradyrhizobium sp. USDA 4532]|nr:MULTISPECIES: hypothetical protein [unclassified Bradyrhizobium]MCP1835558.1 hypothetical protein [Bradyrhizobium sp. USDA 4545]MCP1920306.1 hypothetical protein [Bradyrhizobium sp. USDA 4532]